MTRTLVYIISPIHVVSSVGAIRALHGNSLPEATFLVHWPGLHREIVEDIQSVVSAISRNFSFVTDMIALSSDEKDRLGENGGLGGEVSGLKTLIGHEFDEIYYAHDIEGGMFELLCAAFPRAKKICFGDALGNVYEKQVHLGLLKRTHDAADDESRNSGLLIRMRTLLERLKRLTASKGKTCPDDGREGFRPDSAVLALPVDQSGNFLKNVDFMPCPRQIILETLEECVLSATDLQDYIGTLMSEFEKRSKYLLLTDNIAEGNFIEFSKEIEMYCSILRQYCTPGDVVFLKSHPGESLPRNRAIKDRLGDIFDIQELDERFKRYPIELWKPLVTGSKVICLSYPVLSLKYLYGTDVIQPMDAPFIERWFPEWTWASYKNAVTLYMEPLKRLSEWDGKSVLWAGNSG